MPKNIEVRGGHDPSGRDHLIVPAVLDTAFLSPGRYFVYRWCYTKIIMLSAQQLYTTKEQQRS